MICGVADGSVTARSIGSVVNINRFPFKIVGVAPRGFHGSMSGQQLDVWVPASMLGQIVPTGAWWLRDRGRRTFRVFARVRDGISFGAARDEVESFTSFMAKTNGGASKGMGASGSAALAIALGGAGRVCERR